MRIEFAVQLPADVESVSFIRGLCRQALVHLGTDDVIVEDLSLALTEACANVVQHAGTQQDYEVGVLVDDDLCRIVVEDHGDGFERATQSARTEGGTILEHGRGIQLMEMLVDSLRFERDPSGRHQVVLERRLTPA